MALHGWESTAEKLSSLAAHGHWGEMPGLISEEMLSAFAVIAAPNDLASALKARYQGIADRLTLYLPFIPGERDDFWRDLVQAF
jgi:hypothetical protein